LDVVADPEGGRAVLVGAWIGGEITNASVSAGIVVVAAEAPGRLISSATRRSSERRRRLFPDVPKTRVLPRKYVLDAESACPALEGKTFDRGATRYIILSLDLQVGGVAWDWLMRYGSA
jgi:hypothetical protein